MAKKVAKKSPAKTLIKHKIDLSQEARVHEVLPREVSGGRTGKRFEYQYERTTSACLELLESNETSCIFCEWHDDFVVEKKDLASAKVLYAFNQVKTREGSLGPWELWEVFGVNKTKTTAPTKVASSFVFKLIRHFVDFGKTCDEIVFVTNSAFDKEFESFISDVKVAKSEGDLNVANKAIFDTLFKAYDQCLESLTESDFFSYLKKLTFLAEDAPLDKSKMILRAELVDKIFEYSEIELNRGEALKIVSELLDLVREKSQKTFTSKTADGHLRRGKGVQLAEVLKMLSLSHDGYEALLKGESKDALKQLSRLKRLLINSDSGITERQITDFCVLKSNWDSWRRKLRHDENSSADMLTLRTECNDLLVKLKKNEISIRDLPTHTEILAKKYAGCFSWNEKLDKSLVFGCVFSLAAEG